MTCPMTQRRIAPAACLLCKHFGGFQGGVVCYYANRRIPYDPPLQAILAADRNRERPSRTLQKRAS